MSYSIEIHLKYFWERFKIIFSNIASMSATFLTISLSLFVNHLAKKFYWNKNIARKSHNLKQRQVLTQETKKQAPSWRDYLPADSAVSKPSNVLLAIFIKASRGESFCKRGRDGSSSSTLISSSSEEHSLSLPGLHRESQGLTMLLTALLFKFLWTCRRLTLLLFPPRISEILNEVKGLLGFLGGPTCTMASFRRASYWSRILSAESKRGGADMIFIGLVLMFSFFTQISTSFGVSRP